VDADAVSQLGGAAAALAGLVLVLGGAALAPVAVGVSRWLSPGRNVFFARWGFSHVAMTAIFAFGALMFFSVLVSPLRGLGAVDVTIALVATALAMGATCALIGWFALRLDPDGLRSLGLRPGGNGRAVAAGLTSYVLTLPAVLGLGLAWPWLMELLELTYEPQAVAVGMLDLHGPELLLGIVLAVVVIPLFEETVFRGFLQPLLVQNLGDRGGVAATSFVFGLLHGTSSLLPIFGLSLVLGAIMLRTQRLAAPWAVHALHNGLMLALLLLYPESRELLGQEPGS
jgi:membrane protease YdiL (CAAX protease family)